MTDQNDLSKRTLTINRIMDAPIELVWEAWTQPEHIAKWWGPRGMPVNVIKHNFEVGGQWRYTMDMPDGNVFVSEGVYREIVPLEKIISSADFKPMTAGVEIQALFEKQGDKTNFMFNVVHPTAEYCKQQEEMGFYNGWGSIFEGMNAYLGGLS